MAVVFVKNGGEFLVDDADYLEVCKHKWHFGSGGQPVRTVKGYKVSLARTLANTPENMVVDHIDGNTRNNHRKNLRNVTPAQNSKNRGKYAKAKSKHKGVSLHNGGKWQSYCNGKYLGLFTDELDAAKAYIKQSELEFGEFNRKIDL